jgi:hypothetical protein
MLLRSLRGPGWLRRLATLALLTANALIFGLVVETYLLRPARERRRALITLHDFRARFWADQSDASLDPDRPDHAFQADYRRLADDHARCSAELHRAGAFDAQAEWARDAPLVGREDELAGRRSRAIDRWLDSRPVEPEFPLIRIPPLDGSR